MAELARLLTLTLKAHSGLTAFTPLQAGLGMDPDAISENVLCARANTFDQQEDLLDGLCAIMVQEPFKLLIVDSVMANLRADYCGPRRAQRAASSDSASI